MNTQDMLYRFQEINENSSKNLGREFSFVDTDTILHYLNMAQERLFKERYLSSGLNSIQTINGALNDLNKLIKTDSATVQGKSSIYKEAYILKVPDECIFPIKVLAASINTVLGNTSNSLSCNLIDYSRIDRFLTNNFNAPILLRPVYLFNYGGSEINFSFDTTVYSYLWSNPITSQVDLNNYGSGHFVFNWADLSESVVQLEETNNPIYTFIWNSLIPTHTTIEVTDSYLSTWSATINTQNEITESELFQFIWSALIPTQEEALGLFNIEFEWSNLLNTQEIISILYNTEFEWNDSVNVQTDEVLEFYNHLWSNLVETQNESTLGETVTFEWGSIINNQTELSSAVDYTFSWNRFFLDDVVLYDIPINVQTETEVGIELQNIWSDTVNNQTEEIMANVFNFIWSNLLNSQVDYINGISNIWTDTINMQISMDFVVVGEATV